MPKKLYIGLAPATDGPFRQALLRSDILGAEMPKVFHEHGTLLPLLLGDEPCTVGCDRAMRLLATLEGFNIGIKGLEVPEQESRPWPKIYEPHRPFQCAYLTSREARVEKDWPIYQVHDGQVSYGNSTLEEVQIPETWGLHVAPDRIGRTVVSYASYRVRYKSGFLQDFEVPALARSPEDLEEDHRWRWALAVIGDARGAWRAVVETL